MSPNEDLVRRFVRALVAQDEDEIRLLVAPEILDEVLAGTRKVLSYMDREVTVEKVVERGDVVVGCLRAVMRWKESGEVANESDFAALWHVRDGKIVARELFDDANEALAAAPSDPSA